MNVPLVAYEHLCSFAEARKSDDHLFGRQTAFGTRLHGFFFVSSRDSVWFKTILVGFYRHLVKVRLTRGYSSEDITREYCYEDPAFPDNIKMILADYLEGEGLWET